MKKEELLEIYENGMTVEEMIRRLEKFDKGMIVVNKRSKEYLPVSNISKASIDYCCDEIITKNVVAIW